MRTSHHALLMNKGSGGILAIKKNPKVYCYKMIDQLWSGSFIYYTCFFSENLYLVAKCPMHRHTVFCTGNINPRDAYTGKYVSGTSAATSKTYPVF